MTIRYRPALFALLASTMLAASPAMALAPAATPEGAQKLAASFQTYFGKYASAETGIVTVTPEGSAYRVSIDPARIGKQLAGSGFALEMKPLELMLSEVGDGTWNVVSSGIPSFSLKGPDGFEEQVNYLNFKQEGVFDPALGMFRSLKSAGDGVAITARNKVMDQIQTMGPSTSTLTTVPVGPKVGDVTAEGTISKYDVQITLPASPGVKPGPAKQVAINLNSGTFTLGMKEFHSRDALDLLAFFVANPDKEAIVAKQADLKALMRNVMPGFASVTESVSFKDLSVTTAEGVFAGKNLGFALDISGAVPNSHYHIALKGTDLTYPAKMLPEWMTGLVPTLFDTSIQVSGMDFGAAASESIEDFSLATTPSISGADASKIFQKLMPAGYATLTLPPGHIASGLLDVKYDGIMTFGERQMAGKFNITAAGMDKAVEKLTAAMQKDPSAAQAFGALSVAKGLGKPGPDGTLVWVVEMTPDRKVLINGAPFGGK